MTAEVVGWTNVILKVGIVLTLTYGFLAMMQRQIMQVVTLLAVCSEDDAFSRSTITGNYTKTLAEIILSIEVIANLELDICQRNFLYTVKRINTVIVALLVAVYLVQPELCSYLWNHKVLTPFMFVPEASIHKDASSVFSQHDVRFPWQSLVIEPIFEPMPQRYLRTIISGFVLEALIAAMRVAPCSDAGQHPMLHMPSRFQGLAP